VGPSGRILDDLLGVAGLDRSKVFVTNVVKYRPPGTETPNLAAVLHAQEALRREFMIIRPKLTILVGAVAHGAMHPMRGLWNLGLAIQAGVMHYSGTDPYQYVVSEYHPQYGVRGGTKVQEKMERDWAALGEWIEESGL
jgi:DNA polymerase